MEGSANLYLIVTALRSINIYGSYNIATCFELASSISAYNICHLPEPITYLANFQNKNLAVTQPITTARCITSEYFMPHCLDQDGKKRFCKIDFSEDETTTLPFMYRENLEFFYGPEEFKSWSDTYKLDRFNHGYNGKLPIYGPKNLAGQIIDCACAKHGDQDCLGGISFLGNQCLFLHQTVGNANMQVWSPETDHRTDTFYLSFDKQSAYLNFIVSNTSIYCPDNFISIGCSGISSDYLSDKSKYGIKVPRPKFHLTSSPRTCLQTDQNFTVLANTCFLKANDDVIGTYLDSNLKIDLPVFDDTKYKRADKSIKKIRAYYTDSFVLSVRNYGARHNNQKSDNQINDLVTEKENKFVFF